MSARLKVLISAYGCEPNKGSEPEVGWQTAIQMVKYHDVTVVTRANNRPSIEQGLANHSGPRPQFIYYDLPNWVLWLKKRGLGVAIYYFFWQLGVRWHLRKQLRQFDLLHHVTFNSFRHPGCWWFCPCPVVLGPLGGGQICPWNFLPWFRKQIVQEIFRSLSVVNSFLLPHIYLSFLFAEKILIANLPTGKCVPWLFRGRIEQMLETGITQDQVVDTPVEKNWTGTRFLWISRLDKMKGGELALLAFAQALKVMPELTLTIVGTGREERPLKKLIATLGIGDSVKWSGRIPKTQIRDFMRQHDAFVFTSLRDTSGNVVLEAMAVGMPVITFNHHGPAEITTEETAIRVPISSRQGTVQALSEALLKMARSPELRATMGRAGCDRIKAHYLWERHAEMMDDVYRRVFQESELTAKLQQRTWSAIRSPKGIMLAAATLFLVGALEFSALYYLRNDARALVADTLPGLAYAGAANSSLAQAFNHTLLIMNESDPGKRVAYRKALEEYSQTTSESLDAYAKAIVSQADRSNFNTLLERRESYLILRTQVVDLAQNNRPAEAFALCKGSLVPAYENYRAAGEVLLEYNMQQGQSRSGSIMRLCLVTQFLVAVLGAVIFIVGFVIGFFK